ncbi:MAG: methylated-DNA--[protein]-cysteine S-methyltransferase [Planctomycetes bacterium]|nr:methylated-DNA--[protein]-cysteine S-methyltransferase [Planctomycetota bacterium]
MEQRSIKCVESPVGWLRLEAVAQGVCVCSFVDQQFDDVPNAAGGQEHVEALAQQLAEYFAGSRRSFTVPTAQPGTEFQKRVWGELVRIPHGQTISYGELARRVGDANASRAVGAANGRNQLAIIVPCHRVIDSSGQLHGYAGGLERKAWLLTHEGASFVGADQRGLFAHSS